MRSLREIKLRHLVIRDSQPKARSLGLRTAQERILCWRLQAMLSSWRSLSAKLQAKTLVWRPLQVNNYKVSSTTWTLSLITRNLPLWKQRTSLRMMLWKWTWLPLRHLHLNSFLTLDLKKEPLCCRNLRRTRSLRLRRNLNLSPLLREWTTNSLRRLLCKIRLWKRTQSRSSNRTSRAHLVNLKKFLSFSWVNLILTLIWTKRRKVRTQIKKQLRMFKSWPLRDSCLI